MKILAIALLLLGTVAPLVALYRKKLTGKPAGFAFALNALSFFCLCGISVLTLGGNVLAVEDAASTAAASASGLKLVGAGLSTGLACIGGGVAVSGAASAAIGAISEDPKMMGKSLIFVALAEGIALYGVIISILIMYS